MEFYWPYFSTRWKRRGRDSDIRGSFTKQPAAGAVVKVTDLNVKVAYFCHPGTKTALIPTPKQGGFTRQERKPDDFNV